MGRLMERPRCPYILSTLQEYRNTIASIISTRLPQGEIRNPRSWGQPPSCPGLISQKSLPHRIILRRRSHPILRPQEHHDKNLLSGIFEGRDKERPSATVGMGRNYVSLFDCLPMAVGLFCWRWSGSGAVGAPSFSLSLSNHKGQIVCGSAHR